MPIYGFYGHHKMKQGSICFIYAPTSAYWKTNLLSHSLRAAICVWNLWFVLQMEAIAGVPPKKRMRKGTIVSLPVLFLHNQKKGPFENSHWRSSWGRVQFWKAVNKWKMISAQWSSKTDCWMFWAGKNENRVGWLFSGRTSNRGSADFLTFHV